MDVNVPKGKMACYVVVKMLDSLVILGWKQIKIND